MTSSGSPRRASAFRNLIPPPYPTPPFPVPPRVPTALYVRPDKNIKKNPSKVSFSYGNVPDNVDVEVQGAHITNTRLPEFDPTTALLPELCYPQSAKIREPLLANPPVGDRRAENNDVSGNRIKVDPPKKPKRNKYAFACAILASMTSILLGYDIGVMSGAAIYIEKDLKVTDTQIEILLGILNLYSLIGSAMAGRTSDWVGRRYTIVISGAIFFTGAILMGLSTNYTFLMCGRFVAGLGVGYALTIAPVYAAEVSPASSRGFLTSFPEVFVNVGILLGYISNYAFSFCALDLGWRLMLGVGAIPSVILAIGVLAMPESPRWLVMQGRLGDARQVLDKTSDSKEESMLRLADIKEAAGIPEDCNDDIVKVTGHSHGEGVWKELFVHPTPTVLHIVIAALGFHFFQQASGIDALVLYSPRVFEKAGITNSNQLLLCTVGVGLSKTVFTFVATFFLDRVGRRPLVLTSMAGMVASLVCLGTSLTIVDQHEGARMTWAVVLCLCCVLAFVGFFSTGIGPIAWVYSSEIFPLRLRAQGCGMGVAVNRVMSGVLSMTFISLYKAITMGGAFFLYAAIGAVGWIFFFTMLPETQGRTLEDMEVLFGKFHKWRKANKLLEKERQVARGDGGTSDPDNRVNLLA
ncbi:hypothetical protein ACFX1R_003997 [Malus domestica]